MFYELEEFTEGIKDAVVNEVKELIERTLHYSEVRRTYNRDTL